MVVDPTIPPVQIKPGALRHDHGPPPQSDQQSKDQAASPPNGFDAAATVAAALGADAPAQPSNDAPNQTVQRLSLLPALDYDRVRKSEAEEMGVRVSTLDDAVKRARSGDAETGQGQPLNIPPTEPWDGPIDPQAVMEEVVGTIERYVVLPPHGAVALALWCVFTFIANRFHHSPRLAIQSPEKRCGKSTLLRVIERLVEKPLQASNITPAAVFRTIELARPTLLLDEVDTFLTKSDDMRGILNAGWEQNGSVIRTVGEDHEPRKFAVCCPLVMAGIGRLPDTLEDRSIPLTLKRKTKEERVERLDSTRLGHVFDALRRRMARLALDLNLGDIDPALPEALNDRAADNWRPLIAIADAIGGVWPSQARDAAIALSAGVSTDENSHRVQLLADIRRIFDERDALRLSSQDMCNALADDKDAVWSEWGRQKKPITPHQLARLIKDFGIEPKQSRVAGSHDRKRGYDRVQFDDAWARYLEPPAPKCDSVTSEQ